MFTKSNSSKETVLSESNSYIRTMKDDLAFLEKSKNFPQENKSAIQFPTKETTSLSDTLKAPTNNNGLISPFFTDEPRSEIKETEKKNLSEPIPATIPTLPKEIPAPVEKEKLLANESKNIVKPKKTYALNTKGNKIIVFVSVFVLLFLFTIGLFYYILQEPSDSDESISVDESTPAQSEEVSINPASEKYSLSDTNFFSVDIANATENDIRNMLLQTAAEIKSFNASQSIEFAVTDINNNPVAFHIFAASLKLPFPEPLLNSLSDEFLIYFYNDKGQLRLGLKIQSNDASATAVEMKNIENQLSAILSPLYFDYQLPAQIPEFSDSSYQSKNIRYSNIDYVNNLSIDYSISDSMLLIGTSKDTLRSIIDKVSSEEIQEVIVIPEAMEELSSPESENVIEQQKSAENSIQPFDSVSSETQQDASSLDTVNVGQ